MTDILLRRFLRTNKSLLGVVHWPSDGDPLCFSLENSQARPLDPGRYLVTIAPAPKFGNRVMPVISTANRPSGVRIHEGNLPEHAIDCILLGLMTRIDALAGSRIAYDEFFRRLQEALQNKDDVFLTIEDQTR